MSDYIAVLVNGIPAPQGSKRHVGGGRMVEMSKRVGPWREAVRAETQRVREDWGATFGPKIPLRVALMFWMPRPGGHYGSGRRAALLRASAPVFPVVTPDLDKLVRATLDGLKEGGAFADDAQVVVLVARKQYADGVPAGCHAHVEREGVSAP